MSDSGGGGIGQATEEIAETVGEIAGEVKDAVGELIEQGFQSVTASPLTPQQIQQQQQQDQVRIAEQRRKIKWHQDMAASQAKVREEEKQRLINKGQQRQIEDQEEVNDPKAQSSKPASEREDLARTKFEKSKGGGVGG